MHGTIMAEFGVPNPNILGHLFVSLDATHRPSSHDAVFCVKGAAVEAEQEIDGLRFWNDFGAVLLRQWHHAANG
ncbi:MAG: hypothetical protein JOZ36_05150 [Acidobacteria bacterium]|nr:hypothetical protein [Acidobacteriota bacterium]